MPLTPNNREEHWLKGMVDGSTTLTPNKRQEFWYQEIINAQGGGGGGGALIVTATYIGTQMTLGETWQTIWDAITGSTPVFVRIIADAPDVDVMLYPVSEMYAENGVYAVVVTGGDEYHADSANGYPFMDLG